MEELGAGARRRGPCMTEEIADIMWEMTDVSLLCQLIHICLDKKAF
jgi:hypothetical protein